MIMAPSSATIVGVVFVVVITVVVIAVVVIVVADLVAHELPFCSAGSVPPTVAIPSHT